VHPSAKDKSTVFSIAFDHSAQRLARELEDREQKRSGVPLSHARAAVARRLNLLPGTLENLRRGRIKDVRERVVCRLQAAYLKELEREYAALEHELACLRATGSRLNSQEISEVETDLAKVRAALNRRL
jgi:hypothetical protein